MNVTIIGVGGLGAALARGLVGRAALTLMDRHPEKLAPILALAAGPGPAVRAVAADGVEAVRSADVVLLCVKPKDTRAMAATVAPAMPAEALLISCAAGVGIAGLRDDGAVARAMPNIGAAKGASTTAVFFGGGCVRPRDSDRVRAVLGAVGSVIEVADEAWLHAATAIAASGPAFVLLGIEAMLDAGIEAGLPREVALAFAAGALRAAATRLEEGTEPSELRRQVTSPNGTTAAGLEKLAPARALYVDAIRAALARSRELGS